MTKRPGRPPGGRRLAGVAIACVLAGVAQTLLMVGPARAGGLLELHERAREDDPVFLGAQRQAEAAREFVEQARALRRPNVSLTVGRAHTNNAIHRSPGDNVYALGTRSYPAADYSLTVVQPVYNAVTAATNTQADAKSSLLDSELEAARQDLVWRVAERYLRAAAAREALAANESEIAALEGQLQRVDVRRRAGLARSSEVLEARSRLGEAKAQAVEARVVYLDALKGLEELAGRAPDRLDLLEASPAPALLAAAAEARAAAMAEHPLVAAKRQAVAVAEAEVLRQQGASKPTVDATLRLGRSRANGSLFGGASDIETNEVRLQMNLPLYSGGMLTSRQREAALLLERAREELRATQRSLERGAENARERIRGAIARLDALSESVSAGEEALRSKQLAYQTGLATNLSVLDAGRDLARARGEHARARYELLLSILGAKRMSGALGLDDLRLVDGLLVRRVDPALEPGRAGSGISPERSSTPAS